MIHSPSPSDFQVRLEEGFLYKDVKGIFQDYFDGINIGFPSMIDYINASIVGVEFHGFSSSTIKQGHSKGRQRTFASSLHHDHEEERVLTLEFRTFAEYLNYFMLYFQWLEFKKLYAERRPNAEKIDAGDDLFFPPIYVDVVGDEGTILYRYQFREIQMLSLDGLVLNRKDNNLSGQSFKMRFAYNELNLDLNLNSKKASKLSKDFKHDFGGNDTSGHNQ